MSRPCYFRSQSELEDSRREKTKLRAHLVHLRVTLSHITTVNISESGQSFRKNASPSQTWRRSKILPVNYFAYQPSETLQNNMPRIKLARGQFRIAHSQVMTALHIVDELDAVEVTAICNTSSND
ncbi:hypothetical protein TcasGA2_TC009030 [Tribolium castaneum]|uniref:Uncharacterized protein n=1 Tax=Tribolium castaneum TaxID=7070 RepID=D6WPS2_TRICA|nr:hypothetical protein TcasGA2_TC009030 [Tribolium castaneum]